MVHIFIAAGDYKVRALLMPKQELAGVHRTELKILHRLG